MRLPGGGGTEGPDERPGSHADPEYIAENQVLSITHQAAFVQEGEQMVAIAAP